MEERVWVVAQGCGGDTCERRGFRVWYALIPC